MAIAQVELPIEQIAEFCDRWQFTEFALFGSALRNDFHDSSDVDVMVQFHPEAHPTFRTLDQMESELMVLFSRKVDLIVAYISQCSKADFVGDIQRQDAVIRRILVIAEAARRVSETTRQNLPNSSWQEINGMRNRLVHGYDDINLDIVGEVVQLEIPPFIEELKVHIPPEK
ncbi:hypothetical protein C8255_21795 [filamentous cyanobacterium CCP3]|nr:hypothetical protein C8255_21795 [filamentous cyanobacterium CCP3]